jgi:hypothetical protein
MVASANGQKNIGPTDIDLANYARAYINAYMGTVQSESPEHPPLLFKNHPYAIEACYMPNESFCLLFERSDRPTISVTSQDWDHVMGRVMSGVSYLTTVYPHEGFAVEDATAKGRRDAIRDIRAMESSDMAEAARQLEKIIGELGSMGDWTKNPMKMAETVMMRLEPVRQAIQRSGPTQDMLSMVDILRRYHTGPQKAALAPADAQKLQDLSSLMSDVSTMLRDVKGQGERLESAEEHLRAELHEFKKELDKKVVKGLGVILATTDRKIDKAVASAVIPSKDSQLEPALAAIAEEVSSLKEAIDAMKSSEAEEEEDDDLPVRFEELVEEVSAVRSIAENIKIPEIPEMPPDLTPAVEEVRKDLADVSERIKRIEEYLAAIAAIRHPQL